MSEPLAIVRDLTKCFLCQISGGDDLRCPFENRSTSTEKLTQCYRTQIEYLIQLKELGALQDDITIDDVLNRNGSNIDNIVEEMISHDELVWHKRCSLIVNSNAVKRANKRKLEEPNHIPMKTCKTS